MMRKGIMMRKRPTDIAPWLLGCSIALTLAGVSLLVPRAAAAPPAPAGPPSAAVAAPAAGHAAESFDDGDGDELLEHWSDPKFSVEARRQMAGMAGLFVVVGAWSYRQRRAARRVYGHG